MARTRIAPGTIGAVALTQDLTAEPSKRWRGLARAVDADGKVYMVRRWRATKAAAEAATRRAGLDKLAELAATRDAEAARKIADEQSKREAAELASFGDLETTVSDLVQRVLDSHDFAKLAPKTQQDYGYAASHVTAHSIGRQLPRNVDVTAVKSFLEAMATDHGRGGAKHARAVLRRAMDIAVETKAMQTPINAVFGARDAIPNIIVKPHTLDTTKAPTDLEMKTLLRGLYRDPSALPMTPGTRSKSKHGAAGTAAVNGRDIADLSMFLFAVGARLAEACSVKWSGLDLEGLSVHVPGTKTAGSDRVVPLARWAAAILRRRAIYFGLDLDNLPDTPMFGSPQFPDRPRDLRNTSRAIKELWSAHGVDYGRSHAGRRWRVTSLAERGVPLHKISAVVGHGRVETTMGYLSKGRQLDDDVRSAL